MVISVRPIREFREMPITDINERTHPITDTDIRYEGHSVAIGLLLTPYSLPPPTSRYSSRVRPMYTSATSEPVGTSASAVADVDVKNRIDRPCHRWWRRGGRKTAAVTSDVKTRFLPKPAAYSSQLDNYITARVQVVASMLPHTHPPRTSKKRVWLQPWR